MEAVVGAGLGQGLAPATAAKIVARCTNDQAQVPDFPRSFSGGGQRSPTDSPMTLLLHFFCWIEMERNPDRAQIRNALRPAELP